MTRRVIASGRSCLECRRRKIRCDRSLPCAYCTRIKLQCRYPSSRPNGDAAEDDDLAARVRSVEQALQFLEQKMTHIADLLRLSPAPSTRQHGNFAQDHELSYLGEASQHEPLQLLHPSPAKALFIWQTYLDVVDPLIKILHVPSAQRHIMSLMQGRQEAVDAPMECLMFAIYYSSVISLSAADCLQELGEERHILLQRYKQGVEQSLTQANFWCSRIITVLQAFVLYLICGRQDVNGPDVRALTRLAIGNALRLGLHLDIPGIGVFDREIRRRLWWQICTLDVRIAEDYGCDPSVIEPNPHTELPLNVNDASLHPDMEKLPISQPGRSEMLFSLVQFETSNLARRILFSDQFSQSNGYQMMTEADKCQAVDDFRGRIEEQYLSYCDTTIPLDCVIVRSSRLVLAKLKLAVCKPRADQNHGMPLRDNYREACVDVLEQARALQQYDGGRQWLWLFEMDVDWDALAYLLLDICMTLASPSSSEPIDVPWDVVNETYNHWENKPSARRDHRWTKIEELRSNALSLREKVQGIIQTPQASSISHQFHGPSGDLPDLAVETPPHRQHETISSVFHKPAAECTGIGLVPCKATDHNTQIQRSHSAGRQECGTNPAGDRCPPSCDPAPISAAPAEEAQYEASTADLPGKGTVCEWSASLIEKYWEVAGHDCKGFNLWQ
ncbi:hypothetical protein M419DRAFT_69988 [Trichoderma reesei RUT C-30]|uniref:Zn(2)-C6 fungal-type domain-containing protein n=2 Tax=Hypocrea jecorina TaxID=51453 RepID=A0A024SNP5_HYPJR|nr:hypothetical protein M419DRAFT_69988 [Trichoderma reesei RUT C-30]